VDIVDIAVVGSNMVDLVAYIDQMPQLGETLEADDFAMGCGGKGANQAVAASRLGAQVLFMSRVGDDVFADNTVANLARNGVDTRHVLRVPGRSSGVAPIMVDRAGNNRILIIPGANRALLPADIDAAAADLAGCRLIVLQLEIPLETVYRTIEFANEARIPVLLNPAPASRALDIDFACRCDYVVPNETELAILTGLPVDDMPQLLVAAQRLRDRGLANLIVTLGARGALHLGPDGAQHYPAPAVDAIDSTGAGDAFVGCFSQSLTAGRDLETSIRRAIAYASHSVTGRGTQTSYADAAAFERWLADQPASTRRGPRSPAA
jgi:ribokinase